MSNYCSNTSQSSLRSNKYNCPANGKLYNQVELSTILHHIKEPWNFNKTEKIYYFCDDPACDVVYFGKDNSAHMKATWIFSANDVIANLGVIIAGIIVFLTGSAVPDLIIGLIIGLIVLNGAFRILRLKS